LNRSRDELGKRRYCGAFFLCLGLASPVAAGCKAGLKIGQ
jgi:hypothetical protein